MLRKLFPLAIGGLALGSTEFILMGLLRNIGSSMSLSDAQTGHFIAAYALGVVFGAPTLVALSSKYNPKRILIGLMLLFTIFNGISALMPDYYSFLVARFFSGLPHGAFFGVGAIIAKYLAPKGKEATAISVMFGGLTLAILLMVPLLTFFGNMIHWRLAMGIVASLGLITFLSIWFFLPNVEREGKLGIKKEIITFFGAKSVLVLIITIFSCSGLFAWFSYIQPLMLEYKHISEGNTYIVMMVAGVGMVVGNFFGGWLADKIRPIRASIIILALMVFILTMVFIFAKDTLMAWLLTFLCGIMAMSLGAPLNIIMFRAAPHSQMMGAAFMQAAFNTANSIGAYFGGMPLKYGVNYPSLVGAGMAFTGLLICLYMSKKYGKSFI